MSVTNQVIRFYSQHNETDIFERCYRLQLPLLLKGPTGCGKSHLVEYMAQKLSRPLIKVACNEDTNASDLLGRFLLKNGETVWQDGPAVRAVRENAILYLDEFAEAREDVVVALHPLLDHRREIYVDKINMTYKAGSEFMMVTSYNPGYQRGIREIKPSTKQRFVTMRLDYLSPNEEKELLVEYTGVSSSAATSLTKLASKLRGKPELQLRETISTRLLINSARLIHDGMNQRQACHVAIAEVLTDDPVIEQSLKDFIDLNI